MSKLKININEKQCFLCIKTKHFITIRLKNPMETQLLYKYKCFSLICTGIFFDINKKDNYEKTQNTKVHVYSVFAAIKNRGLKERALFSLASKYNKENIHTRDYEWIHLI